MIQKLSGRPLASSPLATSPLQPSTVARRPSRCKTSLVTAFAVLMTTVTACSDTAAEEQTQPASVANPAGLPSSIRSTFGVWRHRSERESCPFLTTGESKRLFKEDVTFWHTIDSHSAFHCRLKLSSSKKPDDSEPDAKIAIFFNTGMVTSHMAKVREIMSGFSRSGADLLAGTSDTYPGFGLSDNSDRYVWTCGPFVFDANFKDSKAFLKETSDAPSNLTKLVQSRIQELCGTIDDPTSELQVHDGSSWAAFDVYGGTSPDKYGVKRPADMTPWKRLDPTSKP